MDWSCAEHQGCGWKSNSLCLPPSGSDPREHLVSPLGWKWEPLPGIFPVPPGCTAQQGRAELPLLHTWREPSE